VRSVGWEVCVDDGLLVKCQCCETNDGRKCKRQWCHRPSTAASPGGNADRIHRWDGSNRDIVRLLYVPPGLIFSDSPFCPHSVFMCFVWISEQPTIISLYSINWLVFITETESVYFAVRTESLYHWSFKCLKWLTNLVLRERIKLTRLFGGCTSPAGTAERYLLNFLPWGKGVCVLRQVFVFVNFKSLKY